MASRLRLSDFSVQAALGGDDGIAMLKDFGADVVILDILMPGRDGIETMKELNEVSPLAEVMILTGRGTKLRPLRG